VKVCTITEKFNIKSVLWREGVLLYSTISHLKYALLNGETGILKCTDQKLRIVSFERGSELTAIDSSAKIVQLKIDSEEF
jgi:coatomer protein complex subunit alpha (xenin)